MFQAKTVLRRDGNARSDVAVDRLTHKNNLLGSDLDSILYLKGRAYDKKELNIGLKL